MCIFFYDPCTWVPREEHFWNANVHVQEGFQKMGFFVPHMGFFIGFSSSLVWTKVFVEFLLDHLPPPVCTVQYFLPFYIFL